MQNAKLWSEMKHSIKQNHFHFCRCKQNRYVMYDVIVRGGIITAANWMLKIKQKFLHLPVRCDDWCETWFKTFCVLVRSQSKVWNFGLSGRQSDRLHVWWLESLQWVHIRHSAWQSVTTRRVKANQSCGTTLQTTPQSWWSRAVSLHVPTQHVICSILSSPHSH